MKKLILATISILSVAGSAHAVSPAVWKSSNTASADTTKSLCGTAKAVFHGACVNTGAAGTLTVYNSRGAASSPVAAINTAAVVPCSQYDVYMSSGITYTNSATANVTLTYDCY